MNWTLSDFAGCCLCGVFSATLFVVAVWCIEGFLRWRDRKDRDLWGD